MQNEEFTVEKVFNNNVVLVTNGSIEKILCSRGIGFGKKSGTKISTLDNIDKVFIIEDDINKNKFRELNSFVDSEIIGMCEEVIYMISKELNEALNENIHVALIDHIAFTLKRLNENGEISNPFLVETQILFKEEFNIAKKAISMIEDFTGVHIPEGEIGFIALHIHSARKVGKLYNSVKYVVMANSIIELIEEELDIVIDTESLDYARFIVHVKFAIERLINDENIKNELLLSIKRKYKESYKIAKKVANILEKEINKPVPEDEIGFIAIHVERLKVSVIKN